MSLTFDTKWFGPAIKKDVDNAVQKSLVEGGLIMQAQAVALAPKLSGQLANSITVQTDEFDSGFGGRGERPDGTAKISKPRNPSKAKVGTNLDYAEYVEFGTSKQAAQPYLEPTINITRVNVQSAAARNIKEAIS